MRRIWFSIVLLFVLTAPAWGAAITSAQSGNWSATSTWTGGTVPGDGDTATLDHAVIVDVNTTVGTSPADITTMVLTINQNGKAIIAPGVDFTVKGNIYNNAGASGNVQSGIQWGAGSRLLIDGTTAYVIKGGSYAQLYARGTAASPASVESVNSGKARFTLGAASQGNTIDAEYLNFKYLGDASNVAFPAQTNTSSYGQLIRLQNVTFDTCGQVTLGVVNGSGGSILMYDSKILNALGSYAAIFNGKVANTQPLEIKRCVFDKKTVLFSTAASFVVTDNYFGADVSTGGAVSTADYGFALFSNNIVRQIAAGYGTFESNLSNTYFIKDIANLNFGMLEFQTISAPRTMDGCIFEHTDASIGGDLIFTEGGNISYPLTMKRNILLPSSTNGSPGKLVSALWWRATGKAATDGTAVVIGSDTSYPWGTCKAGDYFRIDSIGTWVRIASIDGDKQLTLDSPYPSSGGATAFTIDRLVNTKIVIENNTIHTAAQAETGVGVGEGDMGFPDMITSLKNNLFWTSPLATPGFKFVRWHGAKQDFVSSGNADYNWGWNLGEGTEGNGYQVYEHTESPLFSSGAPDVHGGSGDPRFVDAGRNIATYDTSGLNNPVAVAWATGTSYAVGDVVSAASANYFGNKTINYRCVAAHTSLAGNATTGQPGVAVNWRTNWEFMSLYRLREDTTRIPALITWVKAGFQPQNAALLNSGFGGTYIGAVQPVVAQNNTTPRRPKSLRLNLGLEF